MNDEKRLNYFYFSCYLLFVSLIFFFQNQPYLELQLVPLLKAAVSGLGLSFLFTVTTNNYLWKWEFFRTIFAIKKPYIQGRWEGYLKSSHSGHQVEYPIVLEITQTLKKTNICYYDGRAFSYSLIADFSIETEGGPIRLYSIYRNIPMITNQTTLQPHNGAMELSVNNASNEIIGIYYNNSHQRSTYGEMVVRFKSKKLLKQFKRS